MVAQAGQTAPAPTSQIHQLLLLGVYNLARLGQHISIGLGVGSSHHPLPGQGVFVQAVQSFIEDNLSAIQGQQAQELVSRGLVDVHVDKLGAGVRVEVVEEGELHGLDNLDLPLYAAQVERALVLGQSDAGDRF